MKCSIQGCPGRYEPRLILHTVKRGADVVVFEDVPAEVVETLRRGAARDPADRFASAGEYLEELQAAVGSYSSIGSRLRALFGAR